MCKGTLKEGVSTFTADMGNCVIIVRNVSSHICGQYGEVSYRDQTARRLEQIVHSIDGSIKTEIAVVSYTAEAA